MSTQHLQAAEAQAFEAQQSAARALLAGVGTEAEASLEQAYRSAARAHRAAVDAWFAARGNTPKGIYNIPRSVLQLYQD